MMCFAARNEALQDVAQNTSPTHKIKTRTFGLQFCNESHGSIASREREGGYMPGIFIGAEGTIDLLEKNKSLCFSRG